MANAPIFFIAQQVLLQKQLGFTLDTLLLFDKYTNKLHIMLIKR